MAEKRDIYDEKKFGGFVDPGVVRGGGSAKPNMSAAERRAAARAAEAAEVPEVLVELPEQAETLTKPAKGKE